MNTNYAGFWKRVAASIIDGIITMIGGFAIGFVFCLVLVAGGTDDPAVLEGMGSILGIILGWVYFAVMESSPTQGTLGKMALGIKVTDIEGNKIGFGKASGRHFGKKALLLEQGRKERAIASLRELELKRESESLVPQSEVTETILKTLTPLRRLLDALPRLVAASANPENPMVAELAIRNGLDERVFAEIQKILLKQD